MKAAFFHDHRFTRDRAGTYYSSGGLPYSILTRYLQYFDEGLVVVGRVQQARETPALSIASGEGVEMACVREHSWLASLFGTLTRHVRDTLERVDCAIVRLPSLIGLVACREAIIMKRPWMAEVVGCAWDALWNHGALTRKAAAPALYIMNRYYINRSEWALYVTQQFLQRRYPSRGQRVACSDVSVDLPSVDVLEKRLARIDQLGGKPIVLGVVGSLDVGYKGHDTAIRALAELKRFGRRFRLRCLGGGDASRWRRLADSLGIGKNVEFDGILPSGAPVLKWMDCLDLFLIPSLQEGLPRALVEAMSRAVPAIGADTGGIPELLNRRVLHRATDYKGLARLIDELVTNPVEMKACARLNLERSGAYATEVLQETRDTFLKRFAESSLLS